MNRLTRNLWSNFKKDGILFEELVRDLLSKEYPESKYPDYRFARTPRTHDGAKDIVCEIPILDNEKARIWIECKYRGEKLPAHAISMTMVMALLEGAQQIIFFSYSPVNREFADYVGRFKKKTNIMVNIYDDCSLEDLILKHWDKLNTKKYFNIEEAPITDVELCESITASISIVKNGFSQRMQIVKQEKPIPVQTSYCYLNDIIEVRISLRNHDISRDIPVCLGMEQQKGIPFFEVLDKELQKNKSYTITLSHNTVHQVTILLKLIRYKNSISLPRFFYTYDGNRKILPRQRIHSRWVAETPLIGQSYYDIVQTSEEFFASRNGLGWITICGTSGTGKSRLLKEIENRVRVHGMQLLYFNTERQQLTFEVFIRNLIANLTGLPDELCGLVTVVHDSSAEDISNSFAARVLYEPTFDCRKAIQQLIMYGKSLLEQVPTIIMIDNVQNCDEYTLKYINELIDLSGDRLGCSSVILCFNSDMVFPGTLAWNLMQRLSALSAQSPVDSIFFVVHGFDRYEARHFLNECLSWPSLENLNIPETLDLLIDNCGMQPFFLQNMLLYLAQKGVLVRTQTTSFYISNVQLFHQEIKRLPKTLEDLLTRREQLIYEQLQSNLERTKKYKELAWIMSAVLRLPCVVYRDIIGDFQLLDDLIAAGILRQEDNETIVFNHQLVQRYYLQRYPLWKAPTNVLTCIVNSIFQRELHLTMAQPMFMIQNTLGKSNNETLHAVLNQLFNYELEPSLCKDIIPALFRELTRANQLSISTVVKAYNYGCHALANHHGLEATLSSYRFIKNQINSNPSNFSVVYDETYQLLREYENTLLNLGLHSEAEGLLYEIQKFLEIFPESHYQRQKCEAQFEIGKCVAYNALNQFAEGNIAAQNAIVDAELLNELPLRIQAHLEYGYLYYYAEDAVRFTEDMYSEWQKAYTLLSQEYLPFIPRHMWAKDNLVDAVLMTGMLADLSKQDYAPAEKKAAIIESLLNHTNMPFYEAKMRLALCAYNLLIVCERYSVIPSKQADYLANMLYQAIDKCIAYYLVRDYPVCFHMLASVQVLKGEGEKAVDNYIKSIKLAKEYAKSIQQECQWKYLFMDVAYQLRRRGIQDQSIFSELQDSDLKKKCFHILTLKDEDIQDNDIPQLAPLYMYTLGLNIAKV